ncbi:Uncharacterised protein [Slackia heliotrinireducens]|nr:XRE family transcriptional regulator [Slackia heliotrinireducens]VEH02254.1 Uncharacterised protein [Slackia heliotrinireducens]
MRQEDNARRMQTIRPAEPLTEDLMGELLETEDVQGYLDGHPSIKRTLPEYLKQLLEEKELVRSRVVRESDLNETYGYQIFTGQRNPSRDKVLQLAFGMKLSIRESNRLLQAAGVNTLYPKDRRDAIILFCMNKGYSLQQTNAELYRRAEETIC